MASLHKQVGNRPGYKLRFREGSGRQRVLWLGPVSKRSAEEIKRHVTELAEALEKNVKPDVASVAWANELTGRLRQKLAAWGYVSAQSKSDRRTIERLCERFFDNWIDSRADLKPQTINNYQQAARCFVKFVGKDKLLADVTEGDIDAWRLWMPVAGRREATKKEEALGYAEATANKYAKRIRKLFEQAVRAKLIESNPAADQRIGTEVNRNRDHYVDQAIAFKFLNWCEDNTQTEWALIFGLVRFAGFRCPTEVLALTWQDVDWTEGRLRVDSVKTGLRFCPIFPELKKLLEKAFNEAPEGSVHCVRKYRGSNANLRTQFQRLLSLAGIVPWQKPFVNMRASCRTDLQERFPDHVINTWLGQSSKVAERHYLQTTDAHWQKAVEEVEVVQVSRTR